MGGLCFVCLNRVEPGVVHHLDHGRIVLGEFQRWPEPRTHDIASMIRHAGIPCEVTDNLARAHWEKLIWNVPFNGLGVASAAEGVASDYDYTSWNLNAARYYEVGTTPHQNLNFLLTMQARHDGALGGDAYSIGGVETIRGFEPETAKGDAFYVASVEYLHPVFRRSIRFLAVVDAANAFVEPDDANLDKVYVSAGIGIRVRFQAFVALELEIGMAWPLNGGSPRLFASKV